VDFEAWAASVGNAQTADVRALEGEVVSMTARLEKLRKAEKPAHDLYVAALDTQARAEVALDALVTIREDVKQTEAALADLHAAVTDARASAPTDDLFDLWGSLSAALRGRLDAAPTMAAVNAELRAVLEAVEISTLANGRLRLLATFKSRGNMEPVVDRDGEFTGEFDFWPDTHEFLTPPLTPVSVAPTDTRRNTHRYLWRKWNRTAFAFSQP
jgi:hypothetical protein